MSALRGYLPLTSTIHAGTTSPREFLEQCLDTIERREGEVGAFVVLDADAARRAADAATQRWRAGQPRSDLDGMPIGIKDTIETVDFPTGQGSPLWQGFASKRDAATVAALRAAGAIVLGKTTTTEFAATHSFARTRNPHDLSRTPGGSSSGSGASVGAGMLPAALGTQVVGSVLRPASFCGAVGYKPSVGGFNRGGSYDYLSQSCTGIIAASLADTWAVTRAIASRVGGDPGYAGVTGTADLGAAPAPRRLAVLETCGWADVTPGARAAFEEARSRLAGAGVEVRSRADDPELEALEQALSDAMVNTRGINNWETIWPLNTYAEIDASKLSESARERLATASAMSQEEYAALVAKRQAAREVLARTLQGYDAAVTLGATGVAPLGLGSTGNAAMNVSASYLGAPALTLPVLTDEGLPLGLQLMGRFGMDAALFEVATGLLRGTLDRPELIGV